VDEHEHATQLLQPNICSEHKMITEHGAVLYRSPAQYLEYHWSLSLSIFLHIFFFFVFTFVDKNHVC